MNGQLDTGSVFHGCLPVVVEALDQLPMEAELQQCNDSNELLLKTVAALEDKPEHDENDVLGQELKRQDLKLTLLLDMLGTLLQQYKIVPPPRPLELTVEGVKLPAAGSMPGTRLCRLSLYIESHIPKPLQLFGHLHPGPVPGDLHIIFTALNQNVQDNLEKFIFRHHRRRVAQTRKT
jgi:hypothetical protein